MIKPGYQKPIDPVTYEKTINFFECLMKLVHPFMPFVSEDIWHHLNERSSNESIMLEQLPVGGKVDQHILSTFEIEMDVIMAIRNVRKNRNIHQKELLELQIRKNNEQKPDHTFDSLIAKLCNISHISYVEEKVANAVSFIVKSTEFYIPLDSAIDYESEIKKLQKELNYTKGFLHSVIKKLENDRFVKTAPAEIVEKENKKKTDAEHRIKVLEEQIINLKS
jgi:valyl-tRNA synthetase